MESVGGLRRPLRPGRRSFTARHISTLAGCVHPFHRRREIRGGRARIPERRRFANHGGGLLRFSARSVRRRARWLWGGPRIRSSGGNRRGGACRSDRPANSKSACSALPRRGGVWIRPGVGCSACARMHLSEAARDFVSRQGVRAAPPTAEGLHGLYDAWIDCAEEAYARVAHGEAFGAALADASKAAERVARGVRSLDRAVGKMARLADAQ